MQSPDILIIGGGVGHEIRQAALGNDKGLTTAPATAGRLAEVICGE